MLLFLTYPDDRRPPRKGAPEDPFEAIYRAHCAEMLRIAESILRDQREAEDAVQNAFMAIVRHMDKLTAMDPPAVRVYVCKCAKNAALSLLPAKRRRDETVPIEDISPVASDDTVAEYIARERYEAIVAAIRALPETYRDVLTLYYVCEMKPRAIADSLGRPVETVKSRLKRGRAILVRLLQEGETI